MAKATDIKKQLDNAGFPEGVTTYANPVDYGEVSGIEFGIKLQARDGNNFATGDLVPKGVKAGAAEAQVKDWIDNVQKPLKEFTKAGGGVRVEQEPQPAPARVNTTE